jgi:prepilin-type N-terminal cleavage/methylation domain-containing protein/prepilin-type processing-associated H-X9-DG protein
MNRFAQPGRSAFTIIELLVVTTVIGILIALVVPAVQAAREAARRASCQDKLRQLALATNSFHGDQERFPPGQCGGKYRFGPDSRCWSWLARLLPYLECKALFDQGDVPRQTLRQSGIAAQQVAVFLCPSDPSSWDGPRTDAGNLEGFPVGQTNYKGVSGANWGSDGSQQSNNIGTQWPNAGTNGSWDGLEQGDGIMWRCDILRPVAAQHVRDGLSQTFMIGEDLPEKNRWCSWPYANNAYGTCAIPPNFTFQDPNWWPNTHSFRSAHPGGLSFAMADGSVHFIGQGISLQVYRALATRAGKEVVSDY